jgi:hypothetical protein
VLALYSPRVPAQDVIEAIPRSVQSLLDGASPAMDILLPRSSCCLDFPSPQFFCGLEFYCCLDFLLSLRFSHRLDFPAASIFLLYFSAALILLLRRFSYRLELLSTSMVLPP